MCSVQSLNHVWLFVTPWTASHQAYCLLPTPRVYSNSCPSNWWCHPTIFSSIIPCSSCLQSLYMCVYIYTYIHLYITESLAVHMKHCGSTIFQVEKAEHYLVPIMWIGREKAMAPYSSTLAWKLPWTEEPGRLQSMGSHTTEQLHSHFSLSCIGEGNGNPLQCSCLENPRDGGAWWPAVSGSHRVGHDWIDLAAAAEACEWGTVLSTSKHAIDD